MTPSSESTTSIRIAVDTGGTFTDLVVYEDDRQVRMFKSPTTPSNPVEGILNVLRLAAEDDGQDLSSFLGRCAMLIHGTTRAINAVITGNTARTAFLATAGHRDILYFREGGRQFPFDFRTPYPEPYVPRSVTFEVSERIGAQGEVVLPLDEERTREVLRKAGDAGVEAIGVCLLWSTMNPAHEERVGELIEEVLPGTPYTLSHRLNPILREYRRASSTCIDASLKPVMAGYLHDLDTTLGKAGFGGTLLIGTSSGGAAQADEVSETPILALGSGPAMAPVAGRFFADRDADMETAVVADTGGTTYDVSLVRRGAIPRTEETWIGEPYVGHMTGFPSVDVRSVGAGGGSIAWIDEGGLLHVGPRSAGADPGPACYGRGNTEPTVTDASLVLGHLDPGTFLGGAMRLDREASRRAVEEHVADPLGLSVEGAAAAILELATEHMVHAIAEITINQGIDPAEAVLIGGGGAAGLNSVAIARRLKFARLIFPRVGATLSAAGALLSDVTRDFSATHPTSSADFDETGVNATLERLEESARKFIESVGTDPTDSHVELFANVRYPGQIWQLDVPFSCRRFSGEADVEALTQEFHKLHREVFAIADESSAVEILGWRARGVCTLPKIQVKAAAAQPAEEPRLRDAYFPGVGRLEVPLVSADALSSDEPLRGPAIIESPFTTVVLPEGATAVQTEAGSLLIEVGVDVDEATSPGIARTTRPTAVEEPRAEAAADGVRLAIITNRIQGIVQRMANTLFRTARSGVINSARDYSLCILTPEDQLLGGAETLPVHMLSGPELVSAYMRERHPELRAGDAFLHNSPYHGNSHAADHILLAPVVDSKGIHQATILVKAHVADCGNSIPTTLFLGARDVYEEGALIFPCVRVQEDYEHCHDILDMCRLRLRAPENWWGDYLAMLGALRIGEREMLELGEEIGWDGLDRYASTWFDYSEQRFVDAVTELPAGIKTVESFHDPVPGATEGVRVESTVEIDPAAGRVRVDLTESDDCVPAGINMTEATARASAMVAVFNSLDPDIPRNAGSFRRIDVLLREGSVAGIPTFPASCSAATTGVADRVANSTQRALADLIPGRGMAEGAPFGPIASCVVSGTDPRREDREYINFIFLATGGAGHPQNDGWVTLCHTGNGGVMTRDPVEVIEYLYPLVYWRNEISPDLEGAGEFRGAPSNLVEFGPAHSEVRVAWLSDGTINPALGARGGLPGPRHQAILLRGGGESAELGVFGDLVVRPTERIVSISGSGGGYGSPLDRDPERVRHDVMEGLISPERAQAVYGVALDDDLEIQEELTKQLRRSASDREMDVSA